jgi:hypothetical protein
MSKKFNKLEGKISKEYEKEGYSKAKSEYIGKATAGEIYREKESKTKPRKGKHWVKPHYTHVNGKKVHVKGHWAEDP